MRKRRKRRQQDEGGGDRWLITYADMITLLLIFFVVLYAMSEVEKAKFNSLIESIKDAFAVQTVESAPSDTPGIDDIELPAPDSFTVPEEESGNEKELDELYIKLKNYIKEHDLNNEISLVNLPRGVQITFRESILFDLGKAKLKKQAYPVLDDVGGLLNTVSNPVSIEGHTDDLPIVYADQFRSNWELSTERAQSVRSYLQREINVKPDRMRVVGYGEYHPKVPNDSEANRAENRRVNIVILRQGNEGS